MNMAHAKGVPKQTSVQAAAAAQLALQVKPSDGGAKSEGAGTGGDTGVKASKAEEGAASVESQVAEAQTDKAKTEAEVQAEPEAELPEDIDGDISTAQLTSGTSVTDSSKGSVEEGKGKRTSVALGANLGIESVKDYFTGSS